MAATADEMKKLLATAIVDAGFRRDLVANPAEAAKGLRIALDDPQLGLLKEIGSRLERVDPVEFEKFKITTSRQLDHMGKLGPVAFHGSSSISW